MDRRELYECDVLCKGCWRECSRASYDDQQAPQPATQQHPAISPTPHTEETIQQLHAKVDDLHAKLDELTTTVQAIMVVVRDLQRPNVVEV